MLCVAMSQAIADMMIILVNKCIYTQYTGDDKNGDKMHFGNFHYARSLVYIRSDNYCIIIKNSGHLARKCAFLEKKTHTRGHKERN